MLSERFPDKIILPAVGNNDPVIKNKPPKDGEQAEYYSWLHQLWFRDLPGNEDSNSIMSTFLRGGYYSYDVKEKRIIVLNPLYWAKEVAGDSSYLSTANQQM